MAQCDKCIYRKGCEHKMRAERYGITVLVCKYYKEKLQ